MYHNSRVSGTTYFLLIFWTVHDISRTYDFCYPLKPHWNPPFADLGSNKVLLLLLDGYRNSKRMAINGMMKRICKEEDVGYVDLWDSFVGKEDMFARDGLHLSGEGAAVFAEGLSGAVTSGLGKVRYLN